MVAKLAVIFLAAVVSQGYAVTEIWLPDQTSTHLTNPFIPKTIGIAKSFLDSLISCNVIFPNGIIYEGFPNNNLPHETIEFLSAVEPFNSCSIGFRNSPPSLSGTYELLSHVRHSADLSESLTRQRFHLTFYESDSWQIPFKSVNPKFKVNTYDVSDE